VVLQLRIDAEPHPSAPLLGPQRDRICYLIKPQAKRCGFVIA
jgi:hypothetical protein